MKGKTVGPTTPEQGAASEKETAVTCRQLVATIYRAAHIYSIRCQSKESTHI